MRVIVCDDDADSAETFRMLLSAEGHEVVAFCDSASCLAAAREWAPDVAFLDVGMPRMTGYAVARHMRAHFGTRVVLVAVTAYGSQEDKTVAFEAGFDLHLVKPVKTERLLSIASNPAAVRSR